MRCDNVVLQVGGVGFHQFSNFALDDVFQCKFTDTKDTSKSVDSEPTGVVATLDANAATTHYNVACTVPQWNLKWTQQANVNLFFGEQAVKFKGVDGGNVITFTEGVTGFTFDGAGNLIVNGVGYDPRESYSCVFKVAELGDSVSFVGPSPKPTSSKVVNCGKVPNVQGSRSTDTVVSVSVVLIKSSTKKALKFAGKAESKTVAFDTCTDGYKNGIETDTDCGGKCKKQCAPGSKCKVTDDCAGVPCAGGICGASSCAQLYAAIKEPGLQTLLVDGRSEVRYCSEGWDGSVGVGNTAPGWFQVDTCGQTRETGPRGSHCKDRLKAGSARAVSQMLPYYNRAFDYPSAGAFQRNGQSGDFQRWMAPRDVTVQLKLWGASGCVCYWWSSMISKQGRGGYTFGTVKMKKGESLWFIVGQVGRPGTNKNGGWGGGGKSWTEGGVGGSSGSGGTHVFWGAKNSGAPPFPTSDSNDYRILIAGGAGATSTEECGANDNEDRSGGHGGGSTGIRGGKGNECGGGYGGSQSRGGNKGCNEGYNGERYFGGRGARNDAGAGGGGYFGGGGGGYNSGGGGGSAYIGNHGKCPGCPEPSASGMETGKNPFEPTRRNGQKNPQGGNGYNDGKGEGYIWFRYQ